MRSILLLLVLTILAATVLAVSVDVKINVGGGHHRHHGHPREMTEEIDVPNVGAADANPRCTAVGGQCGYGCSGGEQRSGLCNGPPSFKCCVRTNGGANPRCTAVGGTCQVGCEGGEQRSGLCNGADNFRCCIRSGNSNPSPAPSGSDCGPYATSERFEMTTNTGARIPVSKVAREHLTDPSIYTASPSSKDNSMAIPTACAFNRMYEAARSAGVRLTINSAFRTFERQQYFWNCYQTRSCNNGNEAAVPGQSNHGLGIALDLNAGSNGSPQYRWLATNAHSFSFVRTVSGETWHWEYRPGTPKASYT